MQSKWQDLRSLLDRAKSIDSELEVCLPYSGRGMFGRGSELAFRSEIRPHSSKGEQLVGLGLTYDALGMDYIYYLE